MNKNIVLALAAAASSLSAAAMAVAQDLSSTDTGSCGQTPEPTKETSTEAVEEEKPKQRRGRPAAEEKPAHEKDESKASGKTYDDMRAVIKPLVDEARGEEVKKVIAKYATSLKEMDPKDYPAFEKDIAALTY